MKRKLTLNQIQKLSLEERIRYYESRVESGLCLWEDIPAPKPTDTKPGYLCCFTCDTSSGSRSKFKLPLGWTTFYPIPEFPDKACYYCPQCNARNGDDF